MKKNWFTDDLEVKSLKDRERFDLVCEIAQPIFAYYQHIITFNVYIKFKFANRRDPPLMPGVLSDYQKGSPFNARCVE